MKKNNLIPLLAIPLVTNSTLSADNTTQSSTQDTKPANILFVISDDQSYPHASAYGSTMVFTPGFDRVAAAGALFNNFYVTSPGSSPSRASILTGLYPWQIEEAGTHASSFPAKYACFPEVLKAEGGYHIGYTGKGWGPGNWQVSGRPHNPAGPVYNGVTLTPPYSGISKIDYAGNFKKFLNEREKGQPFCFWVGTNEPHRAYQTDSWSIDGKPLTQATVPEYLPDVTSVRSDMLNYAVEIEWFDSHLTQCIDELVRIGEFDNTIIIVTADNGMAFPRAKSNCYDAGVHVPLAICWGEKIQPSQVIDALVSGVDIFPTLMDAAGLAVKPELSGQSLLPLMDGNSAEYTSDAIYSGRERHSSARYDNLGYPIRIVRWENYLLAWNLHPERWPAGDPQSMTANGVLNAMHKAYFDIDGSPSKTYLTDNYADPSVVPYFNAAVAKRKEYELFNLETDPACMTDLSGDDSYQTILATMQQKLNDRLFETGDTRLDANPEIWESYPRLEGEMRYFPAPATENDEDYLRTGWTLSCDPFKLFEEEGNLIDGALDSDAQTFFSLVKPGKMQGGVSNPPVENGGYLHFIIDMKEPKNVNYFRIRHKNNTIGLRWRKFSQILGSNDGENFTIIDTDVAVTGYSVAASIMTPNIFFPEATYRYLKFYANSTDCWDTANNNSVQMSEIYLGKAEEPEPTDDYLRIGWTLTHHPAELHNEAGNSTEGALDGVETTFLALVKPGKTHLNVTNPPVENGGYLHFIVDMKEPKTVNYFRIRHKNNVIGLRWRKFSQILGSNDGEDFTVIDTDVAVTGYNVAADIMTPNIPLTEATYRYLKFYANSTDCWDTANNNSVQITELFLGRKTTTSNKVIDVISADDPVVSTEYYNLQGIRLGSNPIELLNKGASTGYITTYIIKELYQSGKVSGRKVMYNR
ncbi:MAG: hypothetical protein BGO29_00430 [Bacteroidales bacterium 36-12]|nr:MAG: hypothetical protein BGO29_00430 [Bacteroidales bacterium 36-12]